MEGRQRKDQIVVIGAVTCSPELSAIAYEVGAIAANGFFLVCGGLAGVMPEKALIQGLLAVCSKTGKPVVGITTWEPGGRVPMATGGREAATMVLEMLR